MDTRPLIGLFTGRARARWPGKPPSGIDKTPATGPLTVTHTGLVGDEQADLSVHGGPDKALHHYPADSYPLWHDELESDSLHLEPGRFGENISTRGWTEDDVAIGDTFRFGTALVQISQVRQPCWKLVAHTGIDSIAYRIRKTARTGWYYRVIEEGIVAPGDAMTRIDRSDPAYTVRRVARARFDPDLSAEDARAIAALPLLAEEWRAAFAARAG